MQGRSHDGLQQFGAARGHRTGIPTRSQCYFVKPNSTGTVGRLALIRLRLLVALREAARAGEVPGSFALLHCSFATTPPWRLRHARCYTRSPQTERTQ